MRNYLFLLLTILLVTTACKKSGGGDNPDPTYNIQMTAQNFFGGDQNETPYKIIATPDGGSLMVGYTTSTENGDVGTTNGGTDAWVLKTDRNGNKMWAKSLGGNGYDFATAVANSNEGGYLVTGYTSASNNDVWLIKLKNNGDTEWTRAVGGTGYERCYAITPTADGGYIMTGMIQLANTSYTDFWIAKINDAGVIVWSNRIGGDGADVATSVVNTPEGGCMVAGYTNSTNGDVTGNHGAYDAWIIKIKPDGVPDWKKCFGSESTDFANAITATADGGYVFAGSTGNNNSGGTHGGEDMWAVKINANGEKIWQATVGGTDDEGAVAIAPASNNGVVLAGYTQSNKTGDVGEGKGGDDAWIVRLNSIGQLETQKVFGSTADEGMTSLVVNAEREFRGLGYAIKNTTTGQDFWLLQFKDR